MNAVAFLDASTGWTVGDSGIVMKYSATEER